MGNAADKAPSEDVIDQAGVIARKVQKLMPLLEFLANTAGQYGVRLSFITPSVTDGPVYYCTAGATQGKGRLSVSITAWYDGSAWLGNEANVTALNRAMKLQFPGSRRVPNGKNRRIMQTYSIPLG